MPIMESLLAITFAMVAGIHVLHDVATKLAVLYI